MRVLVCDDEQLARDRLKRLVDKIENAEVVAEAANGREAIIEAQSCKPDVVLMDIRMPEMDGMEAAEHLGKMDNPPAFQRNIVSGYSKMTMKMWKCERCHALKGQSNACYTCHK